jgi:hypothetical protein
MRLILGIFVFWLVSRWIILHKANKKLGSTISSSKIPFYDLQYTFYLLIIGVVSLFSNPQKIKWR